MKRLLLASVLIVATTMAAAAAQIRITSQSGAWTSYEGANEFGKPMCGVMVRGSDKSIHIKWFEGMADIVVHAFKQSWHIPDGIEMQVEVGFDKWSAGNRTATGYAVTNGGSDYIAFRIPNSELAHFMEAFQDASKMWLAFPSGNETPWFANMNGSRTIAIAFRECVYRRLANPSSQPYGGGAQSSQPHGSTQPPKKKPYEETF